MIDLTQEVKKPCPGTQSTKAQEMGLTCAPGLAAHSALRRSKLLVRTSRRTAPGVMLVQQLHYLRHNMRQTVTVTGYRKGAFAQPEIRQASANAKGPVVCSSTRHKFLTKGRG